MDKLRVDSGVKKIEVNDDGECIEFSLTSSDFFRAFLDISQWFDEQKNRQDIKEMEQQEDAVLEDKGSINYGTVNTILDIREKISKEACEKIDNIFGPESSRKIFGGIIPDLFMIADFFEQIAPLIEKYAKERNQTINKKYSKNRRGAKS